MAINIGARFKNAWNAFANRDPTPRYPTSIWADYGTRPDRTTLRPVNAKSIITPVLNRIAMDVSNIEIKHCRLDDNHRFKEEINSGLNDCLTFSANIDQTGRAFIKDIALSLIVLPVSKQNPNNDNKNYWTGTKVKGFFNVAAATPEQLSAPTVELDSLKLTVYIDVTSKLVDAVQFQVFNGSKKYKTVIANVKAGRATAVLKSVPFDGNFRVRCRGLNYIKSNQVIKGMSVAGKRVEGPWSEYSSDTKSRPSAPENVKVIATDKTTAKVSFDKKASAKSYTVEYAKKKSYFDASSEVQSADTTKTYAIITGIEQGSMYYFRVKAVNDNGESKWSNIVSLVFGSTPEAPTTWSSTTICSPDNTPTLYWIHNSEDNSLETAAQIKVEFEMVDGGKSTDILTDSRKQTEEDRDKGVPMSFEDWGTHYTGINFDEVSKVYWSVCTKGVTDYFGPWSVRRELKFFSQPTIGVDVRDTISIYPITFNCTVGPQNQTPVSYSLSIKATDAYETTGIDGEKIYVAEGQEVFNRVFYTDAREFKMELTPADLILDIGDRYEFEITVAMNSGLTGTNTGEFVFAAEPLDLDISAVLTCRYSREDQYC